VSDNKSSGRRSAKKKKEAESTPEEEQEEARINSLMSEIESDMRDDQLQQIWGKYKNGVIGSVVALILGVAGFQYLDSIDQARLNDQANAFSQALEDLSVDNADTALKTLRGVSEQGGNYGALADLRRAAVLIEQGDANEALGIYRNLSSDTSVDSAFTHLAGLLWALHGMETEDPDALEAVLMPLTNPSNAYTYSASELLAVLYAKRGEMQQAIAILEGLVAEVGTPSSVRVRAQELIAVYQSPNVATSSPSVQ